MTARKAVAAAVMAACEPASGPAKSRNSIGDSRITECRVGIPVAVGVDEAISTTPPDVPPPAAPGDGRQSSAIPLSAPPMRLPRAPRGTTPVTPAIRINTPVSANRGRDSGRRGGRTGGPLHWAINASCGAIREAFAIRRHGEDARPLPANSSKTLNRLFALRRRKSPRRHALRQPAHGWPGEVDFPLRNRGAGRRGMHQGRHAEVRPVRRGGPDEKKLAGAFSRQSWPPVRRSGHMVAVGGGVDQIGLSASQAVGRARTIQPAQ